MSEWYTVIDCGKHDVPLFKPWSTKGVAKDAAKKYRKICPGFTIRVTKKPRLVDIYTKTGEICIWVELPES